MHARCTLIIPRKTGILPSWQTSPRCACVHLRLPHSSVLLKILRPLRIAYWVCGTHTESSQRHFEISVTELALKWHVMRVPHPD